MTGAIAGAVGTGAEIAGIGDDGQTKLADATTTDADFEEKISNAKNKSKAKSKSK